MEKLYVLGIGACSVYLLYECIYKLCVTEWQHCYVLPICVHIVPYKEKVQTLYIWKLKLIFQACLPLESLDNFSKWFTIQ